jgi:hypothetical protein
VAVQFNLLVLEDQMRFSTPLLAVPLIGLAVTAELTAQAKPASSGLQVTADTIPVAVRWNRLVPGFTEQAAARRRAARKAAAGDSAALRRIAQTQLPMPFRVYTLLSIAQYAAANSAIDDHTIPAQAAIASASAAVLSEMFSDSTVRASIARELALDIGRAPLTSRAEEQVTAARKLGEDVAARVIAWAPVMNLVGPWNGTLPTGPGVWYSARGVPPIGINVAASRTWLLDSTSQFRPAPPPAWDSPAFKAALEEVRRVARERTPQQTEIAQRWDSSDPWTLWNDTASSVLRRNKVSEAEAARVLAVLNVAASDAIIACFEAKYHYWTIRPSQADTALALADSVGLPNFPSYPSGHACSAGAFDAVLGHFFPADRAKFTRIAEEQAMSRLYGGIHYRFDNDAGLALGRVVALHDVERERLGGLYAWRQGAVSGKR